MAVEVVGGSTRVGHSICIRALVHVIVGARSTLSYDVCLRHKAWDDRLLYNVYERRTRSQCVI